MEPVPGKLSVFLKSRNAVFILLLVLLAIWWALLLPRGETSVFARVPVLDEVFYLDRAADPEAPAEGHFISPLYPRLIRWSGSAIDLEEGQLADPSSLRGIRLLQIACWLAVVFLLQDTMRRVLADQIADNPRLWPLTWLPSFLFALYAPAAIYSFSILLELPLLLLAMILVWGLSWQDRGWKFALTTGLALGLAGLLRGTTLVLLVIPLVAILGSGSSLTRRLVFSALLLLAAASPLIPDSLHNSRQAGRWTGPTLNAGVNLYIGNGPEANGFYVAAVPGDWRTDPAGQAFLAKRFGQNEIGLAQADSIWTAAAFESMRENPTRTFGLWAKKVWLHLQSWEIDQLTPQGGWMGEVSGLKLHFLPYGALMVLGIAGAAVAAGRYPAVLIWTGALLLLISVQSIFFVVSRYRLILVPLLCLLAGVGVVHLATTWRLGRKSLLVWGSSAVLGLLVTIPWGLDQVQDRWLPLAQANEARRWAVVGQAEASKEALERSVTLYQQSVAGHPDTPGPWLGLAASLEALDRRQEARDVLAQAALEVPDDLNIRRMLVGSLLADGMRSDALAQAQALLRKYPTDAETLHNSVVLLAGFGNTRDAFEQATLLVEAHPDDPRGYLDMGILLARSGRTEEAAEVFREGLKHVPWHPGLQHNLDLVDP